jgi:hypothetical protein
MAALLKASLPPTIGDPAVAVWKSCRSALTWPFDAMRAQHASAVRAGLLPNSMLESRDFEQTVGALERLALGPLARRV